MKFLSPRFFGGVFLVFLVALGVRALMLQDSLAEADRVQWAVTANYKHFARLLAEEGAAGFYSRASMMADPDTLGHPPGYPILLALVGVDDRRARLLQITADALAAVLVVLIAAELLPRGAALLAGMLVALAPQFAWNSVLLLPDTLAVLPLLAAVYCLVRASRGPRLILYVAAGALVGLSCWLRANALLLAPFLAAAVFLLEGRGGEGARRGLLVLAGAVLVVAPLTLRNAVVFGAFIPVSLGAGQTLLEGVADYDREGRFGIPDTDVGIQHQEAEATGRADYALTLFGPDAIARDRARLSRGLGTILRNPFWFFSVMARRAASMLRLERARRVSPAAPPLWTHYPRLVVSFAQKAFITAVMLPLMLAGLVLAFREAGRRRALALLVVVPAYYVCVQSALHTEYRYVLAIHYFLFAFAAFAVYGAAQGIKSFSRLRGGL
ncbi:MAG TPA: glycosyltransferase family 39 protein [Pyrinomonadaceae bacterium]|nr:glycosyltransferase family 39 protein [Pyrinomonadaceae bacterium]